MSRIVYLWDQEVPFANGSKEEDTPSLVPYLIDKANSPAVIVCPGGSYTYRASHEGEPVALWLNSIGISAFVLNYRVAPYHPSVSLLDAKRAVRLLRCRADEFRIDPHRIGMIGFSAGGHLTAMAGTLFDAGIPDAEDVIDRQSSRPDLLILGYPLISFLDPPREEFLDEHKADRYVSESTPPAFLWHTADDDVVPSVNSIYFAEALSKYHIQHSLHIFAQGIHGLGLAEEHDECRLWTQLCAGWLKGRQFI